MRHARRFALPLALVSVVTLAGCAELGFTPGPVMPNPERGRTLQLDMQGLGGQASCSRSGDDVTADWSSGEVTVAFLAHGDEATLSIQHLDGTVELAADWEHGWLAEFEDFRVRLVDAGVQGVGSFTIDGAEHTLAIGIGC